METLVKQMLVDEGVMEGLKEVDQMDWIQKTYSIRARGEEYVQHELIIH